MVSSSPVTLERSFLVPVSVVLCLRCMPDFDKLSAELVALSRRNSNVRSLALALRRAPELVAACDGSLAILQEALAKEGFSGTR